MGNQHAKKPKHPNAKINPKGSGGVRDWVWRS